MDLLQLSVIFCRGPRAAKAPKVKGEDWPRGTACRETVGVGTKKVKPREGVRPEHLLGSSEQMLDRVGTPEMQIRAQELCHTRSAGRTCEPGTIRFWRGWESPMSLTQLEGV